MSCQERWFGLLIGFVAPAQVSASLATRFVDDLGVPNAKAAFTFVKPDSVTVVGSYASQTVTKPELAVDLAVRMPKVELVSFSSDASPSSLCLVVLGKYCVLMYICAVQSCFSDKDYLNHRYHAKRALYLAFIMQHLKACKLVTNVEWSSMNHDARKPVLLLHVGERGPNLVFRGGAGGVRQYSGRFDHEILATIFVECYLISGLCFFLR